MRRLLTFTFLFLCIAASAQTKWISQDYDFVLYLVDSDMKQDACHLMKASDYYPSDTLVFLKGWTDYQVKDLSSALESFSKLPSVSPFYEKGLFYGVALSAHLGDYDGARARLNSYSGPRTELKQLQSAGIALLREDPQAYKEASGSFSYRDFALTEAELALDDIYNSRYLKNPKSPFVAAAASAIVPGLGKIYAGRIGEGVSSFLVIGAMGAITAEHWVKDGPRDWKTIVAGLISAAFYIGNIYGSYVSVSIQNTQLHDAQTTAILYHIHIPLRSVFN